MYTRAFWVVGNEIIQCHAQDSHSLNISKSGKLCVIYHHTVISVSVVPPQKCT